MINDRVKLAMEGDVRLDDLWQALQRLSALLSTLTAEVCPGAEITWVVEALDAGSATAICRGEADRVGDVARVVDAYARVAAAMALGDTRDYSERVSDCAAALVSVVGDRVLALTLGTLQGESTLVSPRLVPRPSGLTRALGQIEGTVTVLSQQGGCTFVLRDHLFDRPVLGILDPGQEELLRNAWNRRAVVSGVIAREPDSGRPVHIMGISDVQVIDLYQEEDMSRYVGILKDPSEEEKPENTIRRLRDAW